MLTPEQITQIRQAAGAPPLDGNSSVPAKSLSDRLGFGSSQPASSYDNSFSGALMGKSDPSQAMTEVQGDKVGKAVVENALPVGGAVAGAIGGGILGAPEGPAGIYAGSVAGSYLGGGVGELANQVIEKGTGNREAMDYQKVADTASSMGAAEAIGGPLASATGKILKKTGEAFYKVAIPTSNREAGLIQNYRTDIPLWDRVKSIVGESKAPNTKAETAFDKGLVGTESMVGVQAKKANKELWNGLIGPQLEKSEVKVNMPQYFDEVQTNIIKNNPELSRQKSLLEGLDALKEDYKGVKDISLKKLQEYKEGWAQPVPDKAYNGKPIGAAFTEVKHEMASKARDTIYDALGPEVKEAYIDYGNLKGIAELGKTAMTGGKLRGGTGGLISGIKDMLITPIATVGGRTIYRTGQGIEFIGKPGGRVLRDIIALPDEK